MWLPKLYSTIEFIAVVHLNLIVPAFKNVVSSLGPNLFHYFNNQLLQTTTRGERSILFSFLSKSADTRPPNVFE